MPTIVLSQAQQQALRALTAVEPVPGTPLPDTRALVDLVVLVPCDGVRVALLDPAGYVIESVQLPRAATRLGGGCGPPRTGLHRHVRADRTALLVAGFGNGSAHVVELTLVRRDRPFGDDDLALLRLLEPVLARVFREPPAPHLPPELTTQERRVLQLVAVGRSNAQIAQQLGVAACTVRKHLEHAYPKLGVANRLAAARAFEGLPASLDEMFA